MAVRLMQNFAHHYDPQIASTFTNLSTIVPPVIKKQIQNTIDWMEKQPKNEKSLKILDTLANAWVFQHRVTIRIDSLNTSRKASDPNRILLNRDSWPRLTIAYCHLKKMHCLFKINRIESIRLEPESYIIPSDFDAVKYLSSAWGILLKSR
jgi:predicted DNA-binding transcriptional regulator YafY